MLGIWAGALNVSDAKRVGVYATPRRFAVTVCCRLYETTLQKLCVCSMPASYPTQCP
jgi:hypothetical protein